MIFLKLQFQNNAWRRSDEADTTNFELSKRNSILGQHRPIPGVRVAEVPRRAGDSDDDRDIFKTDKEGLGLTDYHDIEYDAWEQI